MFDFIFFVTNKCNYRCSYCDVLKDKHNASDEVINDVISFVNANSKEISTFKFFGGEPLLNFKGIKKIIENTNISPKFQLVTNTSLVNEEVEKTFKRDFFRIFYSVDAENKDNLDRVISSHKTLSEKLYVNLIIDPESILASLINFKYLYKAGVKKYNILPIYYTKPWLKKDLAMLGKTVKSMLDLTFKDSELEFFGFQENEGYETNLYNNVIFVDYDGKVYYSDIVTTAKGSKLKDDLYIGEIKTLKLTDLEKFDYKKARKKIDELDLEISNVVLGQKQLHKVMDYFSKYLNYQKENGK